MKKFMISLVAATSLVFSTGCGGDICEDIADAYEGLDEKTEDCPQVNAIVGQITFTDEDIEECKEESEDCSGDDKDKINDTIDCINDLPDCEAGEEADWAEKFEACSEKSDDVTCN
ncbi:hypothetical protein [Pyxidicoccus xibeiensis]|uniref:hypothetical protein n=1 Tax=Pyxidicoccus xibeiensis TaxID=2906759 RepID=UPI0020A7B53E|nr:hypothetical protein [Pyxidicoccus xibeiensis]MCP3138840.1 hypothetical protein [Pyxidicoccus xibeiensis]